MHDNGLFSSRVHLHLAQCGSHFGAAHDNEDENGDGENKEKTKKEEEEEKSPERSLGNALTETCTVSMTAP